MTCYQRFADLPTAQAAFAAGECRRHVEIDGHVIDLLQAAREAHLARDRAYEAAAIGSVWQREIGTREEHDVALAANLARYFARRDTPPDAMPDLPELAAPEVPAKVERCPWCNGEVGR